MNYKFEIITYKFITDFRSNKSIFVPYFIRLLIYYTSKLKLRLKNVEKLINCKKRKSKPRNCNIYYDHYIIKV
jgi:hypothetical protein